MADSKVGGDCPSDGREWDCCCARCGSSLFFEDCGNCGGEGVTHHDCGEDTCCCLYPEDNVPCHICVGDGASPVCASSTQWCEENPLPDREEITRHTPEWFVIRGEARAT